MKSMKSSRKAWLLALVIALQPTLAFAYIDPNASGLLFQLLAPLFAACLAGWVVMRRAIAGFFRGLWRQLFGGKADR
jgi:hypothetical protein